MKKANWLSTTLIITISLVVGVLFGQCNRSSTTRSSAEMSTLVDSIPMDMYDSLMNYCLQIRLQHPHIVTAQAVLESNHFNSSLCKENNNLFGMKPAWNRPTTAIGVRNGYAVYSSWQSSVLDYALWQAAYAKGLSEESYYQRLKSYATAPNYIDVIRGMSRSDQH